MNYLSLIAILFNGRFNKIFFAVAICITIYRILSNTKKGQRIPTQEGIKKQADIITVIDGYLAITNKHNATTDQLRADLKQKKIKREEADYKMTLIYQNTKRELLALSKEFKQLKKGNKSDEIIDAYLELIKIDIESTEINQQFTKDLYKENTNKKSKIISNIYIIMLNYLNDQELSRNDYEYILNDKYKNNIYKSYLKKI